MIEVEDWTEWILFLGPFQPYCWIHDPGVVCNDVFLYFSTGFASFILLPYGSFTLHGTGNGNGTTGTGTGNGTGKMGLEPIAKFSVPGPGPGPVPSPLQCEQFCIIYSNPFFPVPFPVPFPFPVPCNVNEPLRWFMVQKLMIVRARGGEKKLQ